MTAIERHIAHRAASLGYRAEITTQLSPAWTTDWLSERGRVRLREFGIAPPQPGSGSGAGPVVGPVGGPVELALTARQVTCPQCGSEDTEELSRFGTTACKALRRCRACGEPFDEFKAL